MGQDEDKSFTENNETSKVNDDQVQADEEKASVNQVSSPEKKEFSIEDEEKEKITHTEPWIKIDAFSFKKTGVSLLIALFIVVLLNNPFMTSIESAKMISTPGISQKDSLMHDKILNNVKSSSKPKKQEPSPPHEISSVPLSKPIIDAQMDSPQGPMPKALEKSRNPSEPDNYVDNQQLNGEHGNYGINSLPVDRIKDEPPENMYNGPLSDEEQELPSKPSNSEKNVVTDSISQLDTIDGKSTKNKNYSTDSGWWNSLNNLKDIIEIFVFVRAAFMINFRRLIFGTRKVKYPQYQQYSGYQYNNQVQYQQRANSFAQYNNNRRWYPQRK